MKKSILDGLLSVKCHYCGSKDLRIGPIRLDGKGTSRQIVCLSCGKEEKLVSGMVRKGGGL